MTATCLLNDRFVTEGFSACEIIMLMVDVFFGKLLKNISGKRKAR